ncbi:unnamed protein product [Leptidea sinapis]|uniref:Uncharacterized protein n=1 Tax=Leptidea sinapis TaxID=189913 RepID=A0A5E4R5W3_9NEOP|nr:unnamed protein product [Leptidea sinapis]
MKTKKCSVEAIPEPPPPDLCKQQLIKQKEKAGIKICPTEPIIQPPPPPECTAICIEKIKNPVDDALELDAPIVCVVQREITTTARCDSIADLIAAKPDLPWPGCAPPPEAPEPPPLDLCEEQHRRQRILECKEKYARFRP